MSEISGIPPSDTSPEKATPLSPPPVPSVQTLRSWLPLYLSKTDKTIDHISRVLSTPSGIDTFLLTVCYTSLLSSNVLSSISLRQLHATAIQIIEKAIALPPNTTVIIDTSSIPPSKLLITSQRLKALSTLISDFRIFARLWGLIGIYKWGKGVLKNPSEDKVVRNISYAQVAVNFAFQYLENGAYLSSKGILGWNAEKQNKAWLWSSSFWASHVALDLVRLYHESSVKKNVEMGTDEQDKEWEARWRRQLVSNMAWAPLTLHWSFQDGLVSEFWVGVLGSVAGITAWKELWKNTRES